MPKLIVNAQVSLDGVMQGPGGPEEDPRDNFTLGGWAMPFGDEAIGQALHDTATADHDLLFGRRTYDIFAGYWPQVASDAPHGAIADAFNAATKHVATHRPDTLAWAHSHALDGDVVDALRALKRTDGPDLVIQGSSVLLHQLLAHDVVDELRLLVYPIVLGGGKRLFDDDAQAAAFRLAGTRATPTGVIVSRYEREGDVRTGSFAAG